jgi:hypothetical protein
MRRKLIKERWTRLDHVQRNMNVLGEVIEVLRKDAQRVAFGRRRVG